MKKQKLHFFATLTAFAFVLSIILVPLAQASEMTTQATHASLQSSEVVANEQLPSFIPARAVPMTDAEMSEVHGEVLPAFVVVALGAIYYYGVVYGVQFATNYAASLSNGGWLSKQMIKDSVIQFFGW